MLAKCRLNLPIRSSRRQKRKLSKSKKNVRIKICPRLSQKP